MRPAAARSKFCCGLPAKGLSWPGLFAFIPWPSLLYIIEPLELIWPLQVEKEPVFLSGFVTLNCRSDASQKILLQDAGYGHNGFFSFCHFQLVFVLWWPGWKAGFQDLNILSGAQTHCVCVYLIYYHIMKQSLEIGFCPSLEFFFFLN